MCTCAHLAGTGASSSAAGDEGADAAAAVAPRRRLPRRERYKARLPAGFGRYGVHLRKRDPQAFERMRLLLGFYDQPENAHLPRPAPPESVTINNLQVRGRGGGGSWGVCMPMLCACGGWGQQHCGMCRISGAAMGRV